MWSTVWLRERGRGKSHTIGLREQCLRHAIARRRHCYYYPDQPLARLLIRFAPYHYVHMIGHDAAPRRGSPPPSRPASDTSPAHCRCRRTHARQGSSCASETYVLIRHARGRDLRSRLRLHTGCIKTRNRKAARENGLREWPRNGLSQVFRHLSRPDFRVFR